MKVQESLVARGVGFGYERLKLKYAQEHTYKADFDLECPRVIEAKGWFTPADRTKMLLVREAHPDIEFLLLFQRPENTLRKGSKTTYSAWAEKHGFRWAKGPEVPKEWLCG